MYPAPKPKQLQGAQNLNHQLQRRQLQRSLVSLGAGKARHVLQNEEQRLVNHWVFRFDIFQSELHVQEEPTQVLQLRFHPHMAELTLQRFDSGVSIQSGGK